MSERRQLEHRLAEAERLEAVGKLAGGVAEDFNDLLAAIASHADVALAAQDLPRHTRNELIQLRLASERAADIVRQLLALSGRQVLKPALLDLNDVVAEVEQMLPALIGYEVRLRVERGSAPLPVVADRGQLAQVLVNLVANARDAMPQGGELAIVCDAAGLDEDQAAAAGCSRAATPGFASPTRGPGWTRSRARACVRAVLHDQGAGIRDGPRARDLVRDRRAIGRDDHRRERGPAGNDVHDPAAARRRGTGGPGK